MTKKALLRLPRFLNDLLLYGLAALFLFPLYWMITGSFKDQTAAIQIPPEFFPRLPTLINYIRLVEKGGIFQWLWNSTTVAVLSTFFTCILATMAAYALTKKQFIGRNLIFMAIIATMLIPRELGLVPMFILMRDLGLINSLSSAILPVVVLPFSVFLMRQFSMTIPNELLEAGRIDGCSEIRLFTNIFLPVVKPGIGALAIFTFSTAWNDYLWQLVMLSSPDKRTLPVGIASLLSEYVAQYGMQMAASTIGFIPIFIVFIMFQKHFVKGITLGGIKG